MRLFLCIVALLLPASASAYTSPPELSAVASRIAGQRVEARCYEPGEDSAPEWYGAWGYVLPDVPVAHFDPVVCEGALGLSDPAVPLWEKGIGVLVVTHEAFHLALRYRDRVDEAQTECRAVRHARYTADALGGSSRWEDLKVAVVAMHYLLLSYAPRYALEGCRVPGWWETS